MRKDPDLFGQALLDWTRGGTDPEYIQRADGLAVPGAGHEFYLAPFRRWPSSERESLRYARGRIVDMGSGAGRISLHLQESGCDVVALDASPRAIRSARLRGVRDAWHMPARQLSGEIAAFDTIILFGNNFGMFGSPERVSKVLTSWARRTNVGTRILAESSTPYCGGAPSIDRRYYQRNKAHGLMPGQTRIRTLYRDAVGPWSDWLFVSRHEMRRLVHGTGWKVRTICGNLPSEPYVAVLEK
jgi:SAM-dependent methyltransferase